METFFAPYDRCYAFIAFAAVIADTFVLPRVLPRRVWLMLKLPSTFLHEASHWLVATLLGGRARIVSLVPHELPDGSVALGRTEWDGVALGGFGQAMVCAAPLAWIVVATCLGQGLLSQPMGLAEGIATLGGMMIIMNAGLLLSMSDLRGMDIWVGPVLFFLAALVAGTLLSLDQVACHWFGVLCAMR